MPPFCISGAGVGRRTAPAIPEKRKCFHFSGISFGFLLEFFFVFRYIIPSKRKTCRKTGIGDSFWKIIVVHDNISARRDESGITTIGIRKFLLDENSLEM